MNTDPEDERELFEKYCDGDIKLDFAPVSYNITFRSENGKTLAVCNWKDQDVYDLFNDIFNLDGAKEILDKYGVTIKRTEAKP